MKTTAPTPAQASAFQAMYDYFNRVLFAGALTTCVLNFSRRAKSFGFFAPERWFDAGENFQHEISLNPATLAIREPIAIASTLVHEMCHLWQQQYGTPSRSGYHNKEWAEKMIEVGLIPSSTGEPGGAKTGQRMTHYIEKGGRFEVAFNAMPKDHWFPLLCRPESDPDEKRVREKKARSKTKYGCPSCDLNVWGKPGLQIRCDDCDEILEEEAA